MPHNDFSRTTDALIIEFRDRTQEALDNNPSGPNAADQQHYVDDANAELARRAGGGSGGDDPTQTPTQYQGIKTFTQLQVDDSGEIKTDVYEGLFSNSVGTTTAFFTSSQTTAQKRYFIDVYNEQTQSTTSKVQYSLAFGNIVGSGSIFTADDKPAQSTYKKFANLLLNSPTTTFNFSSASTTEDSDTIGAMVIKRTNLKDKIDVGNWQLTLNNGGTVLRLVDDSGVISEQTNANGRKYYNIVSGTLVTGQTNPSLFATTLYYGRVYQEMGIVLFNINQVSGGLGWTPTMDTATTTNNITGLYSFLSASLTMTFRSQENLYSRFYFCRAKSREYNFSQNPSYVSSSGTGEVISNITDRGVPFTYITGVGLYNQQGELLAVAKASQPVFKEPGVEANFKVRLDF